VQRERSKLAVGLLLKYANASQRLETNERLFVFNQCSVHLEMSKCEVQRINLTDRTYRKTIFTQTIELLAISSGCVCNNRL